MLSNLCEVFPGYHVFAWVEPTEAGTAWEGPCEEAAGAEPSREGPCEEAAGAEPAWEGPCEEAAGAEPVWEGPCEGAAGADPAWEGPAGKLAREGPAVEEGPPARRQVQVTGMYPTLLAESSWLGRGCGGASEKRLLGERRRAATDWPGGGRGFCGVGRRVEEAVISTGGGPGWPAERGEAGHRDEYADALRPVTAGQTRAGRFFCRAPPRRHSWQCPDANDGVRR